MSEPTLTEIIELRAEMWHVRRVDRALALEIRDHDDRLNGAGALIDDLARRLTTLEASQARPVVESPGGRSIAEINAEVDAWANCRDCPKWQQRAETTERERDEWKAHFKNSQRALADTVVERDAAREELMKYGRHHDDCDIFRSVGKKLTACTCGLRAALDGGAS